MKRVILDTDIGPDCDDVAALAMLNLYQKQGLCKILGVAHCTSNPYGAGTIDAVCRYYGNPDIPISTWLEKGFLEGPEAKKYNRYITTHLPNRYQTVQPEDALRMYRRILSQEEDQSVDIIAIGPLNNLSALLQSGPDGISSLDGMTLVKKKVRRLIMMGGIFHSTFPGIDELSEKIHQRKVEEVSEFNIVCDIRAAQQIATYWPSEKVYLGFEAGLVETGGLLATSVPEDHPVRIAYDLYTENGKRFSWDLLTVEFAIKDNSPHYTLSEPGKVLFDHEGHTLFTPGAGEDRYVIWAQDKETIAHDINALLIQRAR